MTAAVETKDITGIIDKPGNVLDDINNSKLARATTKVVPTVSKYRYRTPRHSE